MNILLPAAVGALLALAAYRLFEPAGRDGRAPAALRAVAWAALAVLLVNPGCPSGSQAAPLVLLDGSLSMTAAGGRWTEALERARGLGEVRLFGDPDRTLDSIPAAGRSRLEPSLRAAVASGRPLVVITDGELEDGTTLPADLLRLASVEVLPRAGGPAVQAAQATAPDRITLTDTLEVTLQLTLREMPPGTTLRVGVQLGARVVAEGTIAAGADGPVWATRIPAAVLGEGSHFLAVGLLDSVDAERRDDRRLLEVTVAPTPGVVLVAGAPDWDSRFLQSALSDLLRTPVEGYLQVRRDEWRRMRDLAPVAREVVARAWRQADAAVVFGAPGGLDASGPRAVWFWPAPGPAATASDWYLSAEGGPPLGPLLAAWPLDSFPPATLLEPAAAVTPAWTGLTARAGRRGAPRPVLLGEVREGRRTATMLARGLWRWSFRGGASEQAYRGMVAGTMDWLLSGPGPARAPVRPLRRVVVAGTPVVFQADSGTAGGAVGVRFRGGAGEQVDTLRFGGDGRAQVHLPPGIYTYAVDGGSSGRVAVEEWSAEWFPRSPVVQAATREARAATATRGVREHLWLFGVAVAALGLEWLLRRRRGWR